MEKNLEEELKEKMEQVAYAPVKIVHEHRMSKDFAVLSRKYTLDRKFHLWDSLWRWLGLGI